MKQEKQVNIIVISLIVILIFGVITLFFYQKEKYSDVFFNYNGFDVHKVEDENGVVYKIKIFLGENPQPLFISTRHSPKDLEDIAIEDIKDKIIKPVLYVTMDPVASSVSVIAAMEISKIIGNRYLFNVPTHGALTGAVIGKDVPIKTCEDANEAVGIILLREGNEARIYSEGECVIVEGEDEFELIRAADRLSLTVLGVMK